jgi:hypothetical protein
MQRDRNCHRLAAGAPGRARPSQIAPTLSSALPSFGEVRPSPIKPLLVLWALIVVPPAGSSSTVYDRPTWWRQCHLDVNWQTRSRNRNFGQDEWQSFAHVQRCAVLMERSRSVLHASTSNRTRCRKGSLRGTEAPADMGCRLVQRTYVGQTGDESLLYKTQ